MKTLEINEKSLKKSRSYTYNITHISLDNSSRVPNVISNYCQDIVLLPYGWLQKKSNLIIREF